MIRAEMDSTLDLIVTILMSHDIGEKGLLWCLGAAWIPLVILQLQHACAIYYALD